MAQFVEGRQSDPIGLVVFAGTPFIVSPMTLDYGILSRLLNEIDIDRESEGTAIGMALATGVNRLRESELESKIAILLTDGENNAGQIDPLTAADLAESFGIKVYTIGIGSPSMYTNQHLTNTI